MKNSFGKHFNIFFISKFIFSNLHIGGVKTLWNPKVKPFLKGFRNSFAVFKLEDSLLFFRVGIKFLSKLLISKKKILFLGTPNGLEKEFIQLCNSSGHYVLEKKSNGFFSNYPNFVNKNNITKLKFVEYPSLIFVFSLSDNYVLVKEASRLDIPVMAFVSSDDHFFGVDFPLPANINSFKGSLFCYNLFFFLFKFTPRSPTMVSNFSGNDSIKLSAFALRAALMISSSVASVLP